jgi:hypothetical protein
VQRKQQGGGVCRGPIRVCGGVCSLVGLRALCVGTSLFGSAPYHCGVSNRGGSLLTLGLLQGPVGGLKGGRHIYKHKKNCWVSHEGGTNWRRHHAEE